MEKYTVSPAFPADIDAILDIVRERQQWLANQGIDQWQGYEDIFPREYFMQKQATGALYAAKDVQGRLAGFIVLLEWDPYWKGYERPGALYMHNLASAPPRQRRRENPAGILRTQSPGRELLRTTVGLQSR